MIFHAKNLKKGVKVLTNAKSFLKRANDLENLINILSTAKLSREERIERMKKLRC